MDILQTITQEFNLNPTLIKYLNDVKYSFNSYTMDTITIAIRTIYSTAVRKLFLGRYSFSRGMFISNSPTCVLRVLYRMNAGRDKCIRTFSAFLTGIRKSDSAHPQHSCLLAVFNPALYRL